MVMYIRAMIVLFCKCAFVKSSPVWRSWLSLLGRNGLHTVRNEPGPVAQNAREVTQFLLIKIISCLAGNIKNVYLCIDFKKGIGVYG